MCRKTEKDIQNLSKKIKHAFRQFCSFFLLQMNQVCNLLWEVAECQIPWQI